MVADEWDHVPIVELDEQTLKLNVKEHTLVLLIDFKIAISKILLKNVFCLDGSPSTPTPSLTYPFASCDFVPFLSLFFFLFPSSFFTCLYFPFIIAIPSYRVKYVWCIQFLYLGKQNKCSCLTDQNSSFVGFSNRLLS